MAILRGCGGRGDVAVLRAHSSSGTYAHWQGVGGQAVEGTQAAGGQQGKKNPGVPGASRWGQAESAGESGGADWGRSAKGGSRPRIRAGLPETALL